MHSRDQTRLLHELTPERKMNINHKPQDAGARPRLSFLYEWQADTITTSRNRD
jgi:hypothetical protein